MMHRLLFIRLLLPLALCAPLPASAASPSVNHQHYGTWGLDLSGHDTTTQRGTHYTRLPNGSWIDKTQIPPDKPGYSLRLAMTDLTEQRLHEMMEGFAANAKSDSTTLEDKVGAFYHSFMDDARIDQTGVKAIEQELADVKNAKWRDDLAALMGRTTTDFEGSLFNYGIDVDLKDPKHYAFYIGQGGLGLPDRDYYLNPNFAAQKTAYQEYVVTLLRLTNWPEPETRAKDVVDFETKVADASWNKTQQRDPIAIYKPMTLDELEKFAPGFAWKPFLSEAKMGKLTSIIVGEKRSSAKLAESYAKTQVNTIRAWHTFHIADTAPHY